MIEGMRGDRLAAKARGRCFGATLFALFGACWLVLGSVYLHHFAWWVVCGALAVAGTMLWVAMRLRRRGRAAAEGAVPVEEQKRADRRFGWVNAVTYGAVFLLFVILPRVGGSNFVFPAFVAIVGLHFFFMPALYQHRANLVTGGAMVVWAVVCVAVFRHDGERMGGWVTTGAGVALWTSSAWALRTAGGLLREVGV